MPDDVHTLSGAYAVDALDDAERVQFESHLAQCATCRSEVDSLREAAALMAEATLVAPSPHLRDRVLADIAAVRPMPPVLARVTELAPRRRRRAAALLAAAAAVVAIGTGGVVVHGLSDNGPKSEQQQVMAASDRQTYSKHLPNGATATIYRSAKLDRAVLVTKNMPPAPQGKEYALWLQHGVSLVAAGVMTGGTDSQIVLGGDAASATGFGITVEPSDTQPTAPRGTMVASIPFQAA